MIIPTSSSLVRQRREDDSSTSTSTTGPDNNNNNNNSRRNLIIISTVLGSALILAVVLTGLLLWSRKRQRKLAGYREACLRDPNLTWDDYERRRKLSRSILIWEEEVQRDIILRKTLQSRTSLNTPQPRTPQSTAANTNNTTTTTTTRQIKRMHPQSWHPSTYTKPEQSGFYLEPTADEHRDGFVQEWGGYRGLAGTDVADPNGETTPVHGQREEAATQTEAG
ncbi:Transcription initiation factor IIB [Apiospora saccharicola]